MTVKRVVANIESSRLENARAFYGDILGMAVVMDHGWIVIFASDATTRPQVSIASEGGSGTAVPDLSIEVDNLDEVHARMLAAGIGIEYGPRIRALGRAPLLCSRSVRPVGEHPHPRMRMRAGHR